jgi:hypothetical protein
MSSALRLYRAINSASSSLMGGIGRIVPRDGSAAAPGAVLPPAPKLLTFVLDGKGTLPVTADSK